ncbi:unnamed protein product [Durusdinium trenchii]|uniref:Uncharacterized protein n=2 Tax=Durusdinium trenchii TaxID=1381693 RepID=A0ABP0PU68_9DINO
MGGSRVIISIRRGSGESTTASSVERDADDYLLDDGAWYSNSDGVWSPYVSHRRPDQHVFKMARTTVMLKNLPECFTRARLLYLLCKEGFSGTFNFLYVPLCFREKNSLCYAFINFVEQKSLERFWQRFDGLRDWSVPCSNVGEVCLCERHQGLDSIIQYYRNNSVMHPSVPDECKPILLRGTQRIPFPSPVKKIKMPKKLRSESGDVERKENTGVPVMLTFSL